MFRSLAHFALALAVIALLPVESLANAPSFIAAGDAAHGRGDRTTAFNNYVEAKRYASDAADTTTLARIAQRLAGIGAPRDAVLTYGLAMNYALSIAEGSPWDLGFVDRADGADRLRWLSRLYDASLKSVAGPAWMHRELAALSAQMREHAQRLESRQERGGGTFVTAYAVAMRNGLEEKKKVRGFGDSDVVNRRIPFRFRLRVGSGLPATYAKVTLRIKPIGNLVGTDTLRLRGASGAVYRRKVTSALAPLGQWTTVSLTIRDTGADGRDLLKAISTGTLDGVYEDDCAVAYVKLDVHL